MSECEICGKKTKIGYNRPHSQHRTKRKIFPNIQKQEGKYICARCLRTESKLRLIKTH